MWQAMRSLQSPSFLAYPRMLAHPRTIEAYNDPDGKGHWLQVFGATEDRFRELEEWELYHVYRNQRMSAICWWSAATAVIAGMVGSFALGFEIIGYGLLAGLSVMFVMSLLGLLFGHSVEMRAARNCRNGFETVVRELPGRLWTAMDQEDARCSND
jgi:hypothetical protein